MSPNNLFKFLYLGIIIATMLMAARQVQNAAYRQAMFALLIGAICAFQLYRTLQLERHSKE